CGNTWSPAPGVGNLYCWELVDWCTNGFLQAQSTVVQPNGTPYGIKNFNLSWIASFGNLTNDHRVLRRADFVVERDDVLMCSGISNEGQDAYPLMMCMYNGLVVGVTDGEHNAGDTMEPYDGSGRMRPEIVAPLGTTSAATGLVSGCAALLVDTAREDVTLPPQAEASEVIKAALIAGAVKTTPDENWTNNPGSGADRGIAERPLDETYGAGTVNVDRSHRIISGGRVWGGLYEESSAPAGLHGFDLAFCLQGNSRWWSFDIAGQVDEVSIAATWNRIINNTFTGYAMGDGELRLWRRNAAGNLEALTGDSGINSFASGNVVSRSDADNVELLVIHDLVPGEYVLELHHNQGSGASSLEAGVAWHFSDPVPVDDVLGDVTGDGLVNVSDLLAIIAGWGCAGSCAADVNDDGQVNITDLLLVIANWDG
ncbi:MAG: dockerin type I domain-containing protein, partial [Phycisphaerales bacterium]|nr:dockerin type I domain-containing protein [Phycisphaerales bacterium]